jgi:hypothetical protein
MAYDMSRLHESIETIEEYDLIRLTKENRWLRRKVNHKTMDYDDLARQYTLLVDTTRRLLAAYGEKEERCPVCEEQERTMACIPCGHRFCEKCLKVGDHCGLCRAKITGSLRIY